MSIQDTIKTQIEKNKVMLYMKGSPDFPQCGFSAHTVDILKSYGFPFDSEDVLADPVVRDGIKRYSNWPTIPQLYVKGEFIGGCDIVREMFQSGELVTHLNANGIAATMPQKG